MDVADGHRLERGSAVGVPAPLHPHLVDPYGDSWRTLAYFAVRRLFLPYYWAAVEQNVTWLVGVKNRRKRALLGEGQA